MVGGASEVHHGIFLFFIFTIIVKYIFVELVAKDPGYFPMYFSSCLRIEKGYLRGKLYLVRRFITMIDAIIQCIITGWRPTE